MPQIYRTLIGILLLACVPAMSLEVHSQTGASAVTHFNTGAEQGPVAARRLLQNAAPRMRPSSALVLSSFIAAETKFRETLVHFAFKRDVTLQTIGIQGEVTGEYIRNSSFVLDDRGQRVERVLYHPHSTISELTITKEDVQDLAGSQLFGLELTQLDAYDLVQIGEGNLDGKPVYLVEVGLKQAADPHHMRARFFVGRVWIDAVSFQAVKLQGITVPHGKQRFPLFETERNLNIESLRFPSSTTADDVLHFPHKDVRYRITIRYYDFKRFASRVKIAELE